MKKHKLESIKWGVIRVTVYRGCLIEKTKKGYKVFKREVESPKEVDEVIEDAQRHLYKSIK